MGWCRIELTLEDWQRLSPAQRRAFAEMNGDADRQDPLARKSQDHPTGFRYYGEGNRDE